MLRKSEKTSDAGSQYRCGRVGRGIQPPSTQRPPILKHTQKVLKTLVFPLFNSITMTDGPTDQWTNGRTDKASYSVACPQLKGEISIMTLLLSWICERFKKKCNSEARMYQKCLKIIQFYCRQEATEKSCLETAKNFARPWSGEARSFFKKNQNNLY